MRQDATVRKDGGQPLARQATAKRGQPLASIRKAMGDWQRLEADGWVCSLGRWDFMGAGAGRECMLCRDASSDQLAVPT